ncbi:hypothetical protein HLB23_25170 [Nocardia uniformis]|uniref:Uncharacterized protein n=1 Tax=Nocardia uniformis TaxID=53432 RepID=A0A849C300_9NOCA|nr:hypothetical protein [Nocardia uniformis]NNH73113.1 hypothetical protein [Nocardia uniformis]
MSHPGSSSVAVGGSGRTSLRRWLGLGVLLVVLFLISMRGGFRRRVEAGFAVPR